MFISKIKSAISSKISPIGELYRETQSGIKVYRHISDNGAKVKLSSFMPDGKPFKTVIRENIDAVTASRNRAIAKVKGHNTHAVNHNTGVITQIRDITADYYPVATPFRYKKAKTGAVKEYSYNSQKNGNFVGKLVYKEQTPTSGLEILSEFDQSGNQIMSETKQFMILG